MTTVLIWNNNEVTTGHSYPGHASLQIGVNWATADDYVSWVPAEGSPSDGNHRKGRANSILYDLSLEGCAPDHILFMPGGLNENAMRAEWYKTKGKEGAHYRFYRKNCSNIASRVLKAGSSKGSLIQRHNAIWTPLKVKRLAVQMGGEPRDWAWLIGSLHAVNVLTDGEHKMLGDLKKRDERHGTNPSASYHAGGYKIAPRVGMMGMEADGTLKYAINAGDGRMNVLSYGGNLFFGGSLNQIESQSGADLSDLR
ncbi:hypothetical protein ACP4J4_17570 [Aureimonas ureilytica]|uniref:hypothetical protein n=1 Tax=Aureimonas ureilytica TaxID=401562 RepID=UPI003CEF7F75